MLMKSQARLAQISCFCKEKGTEHQQLSEELFQCCDQDDMMIDKYCKDCVSSGPVPVTCVEVTCSEAMLAVIFSTLLVQCLMRFLKNRNGQNEQNYKKYKEKLSSILRFCKKDYLSKLLTMYHNNNKQTWTIINDIINHRKNVPPDFPNSFVYEEKTPTDKVNIVNSSMIILLALENNQLIIVSHN